jgi:fructose-1-phosphate kinase PfkB-like protein
MTSIPTDVASGSIIVIGLNASFQKTLIFDDTIQIGGVNRSKSLNECVGGKGQNFAIAGSIVNKSPNSCILFQFHGEGKEADFMISQLKNLGIEQITIQIPSQRTRSCTTLISKGTATGLSFILVFIYC